MSCVVLSCDELSSVVKWCGAMGWDLMSLWCDVAGCDVTLIGSKSLCGVNWKMIWWSVLHRSTPYYKVLFQYYNFTTKYYSSTTLYYKVLLQYYSVLQSTTSTTPYYSSTTKYYSSTILWSTTPYNTVLLQYYSLLQRTIPVVLCTTKYYPSTTPYYKVLFQYYSVQQSTIPILLRTTKYYSSTTPYSKVLLQYYSVLPSTTLYYKVLLQYYSVLQSTIPVLLCTTKYYSGTSPCTTKYSFARRGATNVTKCCACHAKWLSWLILVTYETWNVIYNAQSNQRHQMLRLPLKMTLMIDVRPTWHVIYIARSNRSHPPTSPNAALATQNDSHHLSSWHMKRYLQCAEQQASPSNLTKYCACHVKRLSWLMSVTYETSFTMRGATSITLQPHQILRLPRKKRLVIDPRHIWNVSYNARSNMHHLPTSPNAAPATKNDAHHWLSWHMQRHLQCAEQQASPSNLTKCCACHVKSVSSWVLVTYETSFTMRGATSITLQPHQILRLPRKKSLAFDPRHIWNVIYNARSNMHHLPTSPNAAPATKNDAHHWLSWHMQCHLQCAEQQASPSNLTKYCACNAKLHFKIKEKFAQNSWSVNSNAGTIRTWSDHELVISHPPVRRGYFSRFGDAFCIENYNISRSGYLPKFHQILCLPRKVTLQHHQMLRLPRKIMRIIDCRDICNVIYTARSNRHHPPTSPNAAPAT